MEVRIRILILLQPLDYERNHVMTLRVYHRGHPQRLASEQYV